MKEGEREGEGEGEGECRRWICGWQKKEGGGRRGRV